MDVKDRVEASVSGNAVTLEKFAGSKGNDPKMDLLQNTDYSNLSSEG
jgi:hypothetical protein